MKKVKKAVIPAAGWGTRFLPAAKAVPKEMFPIVDKPVIQYIVEEAAEAGIEDIYIITGERKTAIKNHLIRNDGLETALKANNKTEILDQLNRLENLANIHFITQEQALGLGHALWCAASHVGDEPFAVLLGDTIRLGSCSGIKPLIDVYNEKHSSVIAVDPVAWSDVGKYGVIDGVPIHGRLMSVNKLIEKPQVNPPSNYAIMGRYVLTPAIFPILEKMTSGFGSEIQLTDALQRLLENEEIYAYIAEGTIRDVGDKLGYLQTTVLLALQHPTLKGPFHDFLEKIRQEEMS